MSYVTVGGVPCSSGHLVVPLAGIWTLEAALASDAVDTADGAPVVATFGDLALVGTVFRGGNFSGQGQLRVVGGHGGWRNDVPPKYYHSPHGLRSSDMAADAARAVGEVMAAAAPGSPGVRWVRPGGPDSPASLVLQILCPGWWVGFDGRTWPTPRPQGQMTAGLNVIQDEASLSEGLVTCAPDSLASVLPGASFTTPTVQDRTAVLVVHRVRAESIRSEIWTR